MSRRISLIFVNLLCIQRRSTRKVLGAYSTAFTSDHKLDVRILDGDVTTYGIFRRDKSKIAEIVKFSADGNKTVLAEVRQYDAYERSSSLILEQLEWLGDRKDRIKFPGGEWQRVDKAWDHYNVTRDREN